MSSLDLPKDPLIGALLRVPAQAIHRRIIAGLHRAGFRDLRLPHMAVLQYPGPDGSRPSELAERAGMSKQAMNQLLQSLERLGYVSRRGVKEDQRARLVHFTARGRAAWAKAHEILAEIEAEWRTTLGQQDFRRLKALLCKVWVSGLVP
ncbi:MAG: MarR family transcriptional regulator [Steroidobacteraceae bacterium]